MQAIPQELRRSVIARAEGRCDYCGLSQEGQEAEFHIDHVLPRSKGGPTSLDNLALACVSCSLRKGARRDAVDPDSKQLSPIFDPRRQLWDDHFRWDGVVLVGTTGTGRATVEALSMNRVLILAIREEEAKRGRHPPPSRSSRAS